jgi:hypothetical protein
MSLSQRIVAWGMTAAMHFAAVTVLLHFEGIRKPLMDSHADHGGFDQAVGNEAAPTRSRAAKTA